MRPVTNANARRRILYGVLSAFFLGFVYLLGFYFSATRRIEDLEFELAKCRIQCDGGAGDGSGSWKAKGDEAAAKLLGVKSLSDRCVCDCPICEKCQLSTNEESDAEPNVANENNVKLVGDDLIQAGGSGLDSLHPNEEGWVFNLERVASKTPRTRYDPANDQKLINPNAKGLQRYAQSPVPKGSWEVQLGPNKVITLDDIAFGYDIWYDQNQIFQYTSWMGVYCQQDPSDAFAIGDMLWRVKPDLIIEIGSNTGGGAIFYSTFMKAYNPNGKIVTLDVKEISNWNSKNAGRCVGCVLATEHPWWGDGMITFINGRVTDKSVQDRIERDFVSKAKTVLVIEDASHRYPDTLQNIEATYRWVTKGSYLLVQDTKMDRFVQQLGMKYGKLKFGPMRSVDEFIAKHSDKFVIDRRFEYLLYSQHHRGWLRRK